MEYGKIIKEYHDKGLSPEEIHSILNANDKIEGLSLPNIIHVVHAVKLGRTDFKKQKSTGRPKDETIRTEIQEKIEENPTASAHQIALETHHSTKTVAYVLRDDLGYEYQHLQSTPHELTDELRQKRVKIAQEVLNLLHTAHASHNDNIISEDESWFFYMRQPKAKWVLKGEKAGEKVRASNFQRKKMVTIFIKRNGNFFVELLPHGQTFNTEYFTTTILTQINNLAFPAGYHHGDKKALVHFDNAKPHKSAGAQESFNTYPFKSVPNPPFSPDVSPLDFGVFGTVKDLMPMGTIESDEELKETITSILNDLGKDYIKKVFLAWEKRLQQVIDTNGDYVQ